MTIKEQVQNLFEEYPGEYISGEYIAKKIYCTRGAVWKAINALRNEGFQISAVTNKGYCFEEKGDFLSEAGIRRNLRGRCENIVVLKTIGSTNTYLREMAQNGAKEGTLVVSSAQTNGYGRRGRSFFSPADTGLYMSILLRPNFTAKEAVIITAAVAVAASTAIEKVLGAYAEIKWVNDIYYNGKKVAGISTEAALNFENSMLDYIVTGIGINVYTPQNGFPKEIADTAGALMKKRSANIRNKLAAELYDNFMELYLKLPECNYMNEYRKRLMWQGEKIYILSGADGKIKTPAVLIGTDDNCALKVRYENGEESIVYSGEISIRR